MPWTNRKQHAEALENNMVGALRIKPDPTEYKTGDGRVKHDRKLIVIEDYLHILHRSFQPARMTISYPGDMEFTVSFLKPVEGTEVVEKLDRMAQEARPATLEDGVATLSSPTSFILSGWWAKDPDAISMGRYVEGMEGA